ADIIRLCGQYDLVGFLDDTSEKDTFGELCGLPVFCGRGHLDRLYREGVHHAIIAFGHCAARLKAAEFARTKGFLLATAVHPTAIIASDVVIGAGSVIAAG